MSEPYLPVPPPERGGYWDPRPARCGSCGVILQNVHPVRGTGWCPEHGDTWCTYRDSRDSENREETNE